MTENDILDVLDHHINYYSNSTQAKTHFKDNSAEEIVTLAKHLKEKILEHDRSAEFEQLYNELLQSTRKVEDLAW